MPSDLGQGFFHLSALDMDGECQGCQGDPYISLPFPTRVENFLSRSLEVSIDAISAHLWFKPKLFSEDFAGNNTAEIPEDMDKK